MRACPVTQPYLTLCENMDCCLPGSSVRGSLQVQILEWVAISSSGWTSWPRDWTMYPVSPVLQVDSLLLEPLGKQVLVSAHGLSFLTERGIFIPWPRIKPMSPVLQGIFLTTRPSRASLMAQVAKTLPARRKTREMEVLTAGLVRVPGLGNGNPLQYSCLENPMDTGASEAPICVVTKNQMCLRDRACMIRE